MPSVNTCGESQTMILTLALLFRFAQYRGRIGHIVLHQMRIRGGNYTASKQGLESVFLIFQVSVCRVSVITAVQHPVEGVPQ